MDTCNSAEILPLTTADGVGLSSGHFYAKRLVEAVGITNADDSVVRASLAHYTSENDMEKLISVLDRVL